MVYLPIEALFPAHFTPVIPVENDPFGFFSKLPGKLSPASRLNHPLSR